MMGILFVGFDPIERWSRHIEYLTGKVLPGTLSLPCHFMRRRVSSVVEHSSANPKVPGSIRAQSYTRVTDYDEVCKMHLTPGVVHNFLKAVSV